LQTTKTYPFTKWGFLEMKYDSLKGKQKFIGDIMFYVILAVLIVAGLMSKEFLIATVANLAIGKVCGVIIK
jgi:hypothetical protein